MERIMKYAKRNPDRARSVIAILLTLGYVNAAILGILLFALGIHPTPLLAFGVFVFLIAIPKIYPERGWGVIANRRTLYGRKGIELIACLCVFVMMSLGSQHLSLVAAYANANEARAHVIVRKNLHLEKSGNTGVKGLWGKSKKTWKKLGKSLKRFKKLNKRSKSSRARTGALVVLTIMIGVLLLMGIVALACHLSCIGEAAAAVVVLVFGLGGIILGMIYLIRHILKNSQKTNLMGV